VGIETNGEKKRCYVLRIILAIILIGGLALFLDHKLALISERKINLTKDINSEIHVELGDANGKAQTTFNYDQMISPRQRGLKIGDLYAYRVLDKSNKVVIPLDKWPLSITISETSRIKLGKIMHWLNFKDIAIHGTFNHGIWLPLNIGDYTIQLVKIVFSKGVIVTESNFSIVAYSKGVVSQVVAYMKVEGETDMYSDVYTKKRSPEDITVQVKTPEGVVVSGKIKSYLTDYDGKLVENPWIAPSERPFTTRSDGQPLSLGGMGGNPPPGIYNFEILINDNVIAHLKYICK